MSSLRSMRLKEFKGIANNLCSHLNTGFTFGEYKDLKTPLEINVLTGKSSLAQHCWSFIKENIKPPFDLDRIKEVILKVKRKENFLTLSVKIRVDDKEFIGSAVSFSNPIS